MDEPGFSRQPLQIIVRDDDVSALTSADLLAQLYAPLWNVDKPVCLFVVPLASPQLVEPVPRISCSGAIPLLKNDNLCVFVNQAILSGHVEIGLHGLYHSPGEFRVSDRTMVAERLREAKTLIESVFPNAELQTFVPPREDLSTVARDVVLELGFNICAKSTALWPHSRLQQWRYRLARRLAVPGFHNPVSCYGVRWLFPCDEYLFTAARAPERCLERARKMASFCRRMGRPLICVNHHWEFCGEGGVALLQAWHTFLAEILGRDDVQFLTFNTYRTDRLSSGLGG